MMIRACFCGNSNQISEPQKVKLCFLGISVLCVDFSIPLSKQFVFNRVHASETSFFEFITWQSCQTAEPSKKAGQKPSLLLGGCSCWWRNSFYFGEGTSSSGHYRYYFQKQDLGRCITNSGARSTIARSRFLYLFWENSRNVYQP